MLAAVLFEQVVTEMRWPLQGLFHANGAFDLLDLRLEIIYLFDGWSQEGDNFILKLRDSTSNTAFEVSPHLVHLYTELLELLIDPWFVYYVTQIGLVHHKDIFDADGLEESVCCIAEMLSFGCGAA